MASTVALKTGLLCLTLLQNLGLAGLVKLQPYFSRILKALTSLLKDSRTWRRENECKDLITPLLAEQRFLDFHQFISIFYF